MNRRNFFKGLCALAVAPLAAALPIAKPKATDSLPALTTLSNGPEPTLDKSIIRKIEAQLTGSNARPYSPTRQYFASWNVPTMQSVRVLGLKLAARDAQPNIDGLYDGEIGNVEAFLLLNDSRPTIKMPRDGEVFEAAGFRLKVRSDISYLVVWGDLR